MRNLNLSIQEGRLTHEPDLLYTKNATTTAVENVRAMDGEYRVAEKSKSCILHTGKSAVDFASRHHLVERSVKGVGNGMSYLAGKMTDSNNNADDNDTSNSSSGESGQYAPVATKAGI